MTEPGQILCAICGNPLTCENGLEIEIMTNHLLYEHTAGRVAKELAQIWFATGPKYVEGPNQTVVKEK